MNDSINNDNINSGNSQQMSDNLGMLGGQGASNNSNGNNDLDSGNSGSSSALLRGAGVDSLGNNGKNDSNSSNNNGTGVNNNSSTNNNNNSNEELMDTDFPGNMDDEEMKRSIYIGNVDYGTKLTELQDLFKSCGSINRITIMNDKRTGMPKGFAYLEFCEPEAVETALKFDGAMFRGRQIKVSTKRKNIPGYNRSRGGGGFMYRGGRGGGGYRGGYIRGGGYSNYNNPRGYYGGHPYKSYRGGSYAGNNRHFVNPY
ncbi:Sgn1p-like RRM domain containing protein [Cryptosporidium ryanae]|uniref:Sgn1p-like RRM domain containing protein n=1 Tax=Cryptosporidium ryanae TaxID=515981 RepID=UPI00351A0A06|nr:Sgn1p-like RRM domain containing protein [Cryptosporidium ryanae]